MEETNMDTTPYVPITHGYPGQPGIRMGVVQPSGCDGAGQPFGRDGAGQPSGRDGAGELSGRDGAGQPSGRDGAGQPFGRDGAGQSSSRDGVAQPSGRDSAGQPFRRDNGDQAAIRNHVGQAVIIEKGVRGTVITVNRLKHYSFIRRKDQIQSRDIFAREVSIVNEQKQRKFFVQDTCKFDLIQTPRGLEAVNINIVERHIDSIAKLPKIPKKKKEKENEQTQISTEFFKQTITELFREVLNKKK